MQDLHILQAPPDVDPLHLHGHQPLLPHRADSFLLGAIQSALSRRQNELFSGASSQLLALTQCMAQLCHLHQPPQIITPGPSIKAQQVEQRATQGRSSALSGPSSPHVTPHQLHDGDDAALTVSQPGCMVNEQCDVSQTQQPMHAWAHGLWEAAHASAVGKLLSTEPPAEGRAALQKQQGALSNLMQAATLIPPPVRAVLQQPATAAASAVAHAGMPVVPRASQQHTQHQRWESVVLAHAPHSLSRATQGPVAEGGQPAAPRGATQEGPESTAGVSPPGNTQAGRAAQHYSNTPYDLSRALHTLAACCRLLQHAVTTGSETLEASQRNAGSMSSQLPGRASDTQAGPDVKKVLQQLIEQAVVTAEGGLRRSLTTAGDVLQLPPVAVVSEVRLDVESWFVCMCWPQLCRVPVQ
jgi:hypothetical protein